MKLLPKRVRGSPGYTENPRCKSGQSRFLGCSCVSGVGMWSLALITLWPARVCGRGLTGPLAVLGFGEDWVSNLK